MGPSQCRQGLFFPQALGVPRFSLGSGSSLPTTPRPQMPKARSLRPKKNLDLESRPTSAGSSAAV